MASPKKCTTVYLPERTHFNLKLQALKQGTTISALVDAQIQRWVAEMEANEAAAAIKEKEAA